MQLRPSALLAGAEALLGHAQLRDRALEAEHVLLLRGLIHEQARQALLLHRRVAVQAWAKGRGREWR